MHFAWWMSVAKNSHPIVLSSIFYKTEFFKKYFFMFARKIRGTIARPYNQVFKIADIILPNSKSEARQIEKIFDVNPEKMFVVPNGVERDFIGCNPEKFREKYLKKLPMDEPFALSVHRIEKRKNSLNLVKAAAQTKIPLVIIGSISPTEKKKYIGKVMEIIEKNENIIYLGPLPREELADAYAAAHVHVLPSFLETPGLSSLEAGLNGCNLVVGDCPCVNEYFSDIALVVDQDAESIKKGIDRAFSLPRNFFNQSSKISEKYSWENVAKLTEEAYLKVLSQK